MFENEPTVPDASEGSSASSEALASSLRTRRTHSMNNMDEALLALSPPLSELRAVKEAAVERDTIDGDDLLNSSTPRNSNAIPAGTTKST